MKTTPHPDIQKLMSEMWHDVQVATQEYAIKDAAKYPEKHKLSHLIANHKPASYYYLTVVERRGHIKRGVRWCWAMHPNIAGYYLSWRQVETSRRIKRSQFKAHKHRYLGEMRAKREKEKHNVRSEMRGAGEVLSGGRASAQG